MDHHPMRAIHAALAWRLFPAAKFIYVQRHPADLCIVNFMQNYSMNDTNAHFLSLDSTATAIHLAFQTWQLAARTLPINVLIVRFESLSLNPAEEIGRVIEFIGLEKNDGVDAFINDASLGKRLTRSSFRQLADPLDPHMFGKWQHYRRELACVTKTLVQLAKEMGYDFD